VFNSAGNDSKRDSKNQEQSLLWTLDNNGTNNSMLSNHISPSSCGLTTATKTQEEMSEGLSKSELQKYKAQNLNNLKSIS
jgi:hypothetical protein